MNVNKNIVPCFGFGTLFFIFPDRLKLDFEYHFAVHYAACVTYYFRSWKTAKACSVMNSEIVIGID